ncbi:hypothetical protein CYMTET_11105 [Cymbomonas tetramitiformis]|uniref:TauD/TfdA-like domain-containing protein n=1 Tax=Cymbomonas tetramitiformis TaxID=36881 RepID=A0AAE0F5L9_9CHLO|nr:hypothetical protein CYMTET_38503 [Cymbomonas tetramitiformis]KAK3281087.1 hypothetical protein CYMTET_11105 [Cymbomonas tetramitiformis]
MAVRISKLCTLQASAAGIKETLDAVGYCVARAAASSPEGFASLTQEIWRSSLTSYMNGTSHRKQIAPGVFSVNLEPPELPVQAHSEMTYLNQFPQYIAFWAKRPADQGGVTQICDVRLLSKAISKSLKEKFKSLGVEYIRNLTDRNTHLPEHPVYKHWQDSFEAETPEEAMMKESLNCKFEWQKFGNGDHARVSFVGDGFGLHPGTGEELFLNQMWTYHGSHFDEWPTYRHLPLSQRPVHARWGDGTELEQHELEELRRIHNSSVQEVQLESGDMVILDNMCWTHGRSPYKGKREIFVSMSPLVERIGAPM